MPCFTFQHEQRSYSHSCVRVCACSLSIHCFVEISFFTFYFPNSLLRRQKENPLLNSLSTSTHHISIYYSQIMIVLVLFFIPFVCLFVNLLCVACKILFPFVWYLLCCCTKVKKKKRRSNRNRKRERECIVFLFLCEFACMKLAHFSIISHDAHINRCHSSSSSCDVF